MGSHVDEGIRSALDELTSRLIEDHGRERSLAVRAVSRYHAYQLGADVRRMTSGGPDEIKKIAADIAARPELWEDYR